MGFEDVYVRVTRHPYQGPIRSLRSFARRASGVMLAPATAQLGTWVPEVELLSSWEGELSLGLEAICDKE